MKHAMKPVRMDVYAAVIVCAPVRWEEIRSEFGDPGPGRSRGREYVSRTYDQRRVVFLNAGEGLVAVVAATQFAVDRWEPRLLMQTGAPDDIAEAIREVAAMNDVALLTAPVESGPLSERISQAFDASGDLVRNQNRTR